MTSTTRRAIIASIAWTLLGVAFAPVVLAVAGRQEAGAYLTVFVLEKTLSLDNVAMFAAVLGAARLSEPVARRVLAGGLAGALAFRILFIAVGLAIVDAVHAVMLGFAAILVFSGVQMARSSPAHSEEGPPKLRWAPQSVRRNPAIAALVAIIVVDVAFAADSILAAFAVTTSAFPIIAANIFAVLGLRSLYVVLKDAMERFRYLRIGVGVLLIAIGAELVVEHFRPVPPWVTFGAVVLCLAASIGLSMAADRGKSPRRLVVKTGVTIGGFAVLLAGVAMLVLPGPGLLVIVGGLAILATEYAWAARPLAAIRARVERLRRKGA
jgi:tellurite resistance protein TerC